MPWLVHHAGNLISWYRRDAFGQTAYQKIHGRKFNRKLAIVGESVWALLPESRGENKLDSRWVSGIFCGVLDNSLEYLIGTKHGLMKVRTIRRKSDKDAWNVEEVKGMRGTPWQLYPGSRLSLKDIRPRVHLPQDGDIADKKDGRSVSPSVVKILPGTSQRMVAENA